jgi:cytochrome P450
MTLENLAKTAVGGIGVISIRPHIVIVTDPKIVTAVFGNEDDFEVSAFLKRKLSKVIGEGLTVSTGDGWTRRRYKIQRLFTGGHLTKFLPQMAESVSESNDDLLKSLDDKISVDISLHMRNLTLKSIFAVLFSSGYDRSMTESFDFVSRETGRRIWIPDLVQSVFMSKSTTAYLEAIKRLDRHLSAAVAKRRLTPANDVASFMVAENAADGIIWSDRIIRDELMTLAFAGYDTTASLLTWAVMIAKKFPLKMLSIYSEIDTIWPQLKEERRFANLANKLPLTESFLNEVLRLYPPIWIFMREAARNVEINNFIFKKGTLVMVSPHIVHRLPALWKDPDELIPERFLKNGDHDNDNFDQDNFMPFGVGRRRCIGSTFAMHEALISVADFFHKFQVIGDNTHDLSQSPGVVNWPKNTMATLARRDVT